MMFDRFSMDALRDNEEDAEERLRGIKAVAQSRISRHEMLISAMQLTRSVVDTEYKPNSQEMFIGIRNAALSIGAGVMASVVTTMGLHHFPVPYLKRLWIPSALVGVAAFQLSNTYGRKRAYFEFIHKGTPMGMQLAGTIYDYRRNPEKYKHFENLSRRKCLAEVMTTAREKRQQQNLNSPVDQSPAKLDGEISFSSNKDVTENHEDLSGTIFFTEDRTEEAQDKGYKSWDDIRKNS